MPQRDERWMKQRYRCWYVIQEVPRPLRPAFNGKRRLVKSLGTDDYQLARARRHKALAEFQARFDAAKVNHAHSTTMQAAIEWREFAEQQRHVDDQIDALNQIDDSAAAIPDPETRNAFLAIATGQQTPIAPFIDRWLAEEDIESRSKGDHKRHVKELLSWCDAQAIPPTLEAFDRRTAGRYVSHLLTLGKDRHSTLAKRVWSLSRLWAWMATKGYCDQNPWRDHDLAKRGKSVREKQKERPFTPDELHRLLNGSPKDEALPDLMRLALFSGARLEELCLIRVRDVDATERTMSIHADPKTASSRRAVPVHSAVWSLVAARLKDKAPSEYLFSELGPAPEEGKQRSMSTGKAFTRYRRAVGVDDAAEGQRRSLVNFHSFRRTFVTLAEQAGQAESTIRSVVGHKRQGMTFGVYSGGPSLEQRRSCVESVILPKCKSESSLV